MNRFTHVLLVGLLFAYAASARGESVEWVRQLGTTSGDISHGVSADGLGNVYISGFTNGNLGGANAGHADAFVSKYDAAGGLLWTRQLGTTDLDISNGVSADGLGNVYLSGLTRGSLGGPSAGPGDAFVSKYDAAGGLLWTRQLGTAIGEESHGVSADGLGNVYISGTTEGSLGGPNVGERDAFVSKYDDAGGLLWTRQLGTTDDDFSLGVSADGLGNVYISGGTHGNLGSPNAGDADAFVSKYDAAGGLLWTRQFGATGDDYSHGVSADGLGNVYLSGHISNGLASPDVFVCKYDATGGLLWTRQLSTTGLNISSVVSADGLGNVYLSGNTQGSLGGPTAGSYDASVSKYDADGGFLWTHQLGTTSSEFGRGVSADGLGNVYLTGDTEGSLGGPNARPGFPDAFVAKIADPVVPEPSPLALAAMGMCGLVAGIKWRR